MERQNWTNGVMEYVDLLVKKANDELGVDVRVVPSWSQGEADKFELIAVNPTIWLVTASEKNQPIRVVDCTVGQMAGKGVMQLILGPDELCHGPEKDVEDVFFDLPEGWAVSDAVIDGRGGRTPLVDGRPTWAREGNVVFSSLPLCGNYRSLLYPRPEEISDALILEGVLVPFLWEPMRAAAESAKGGNKLTSFAQGYRAWAVKTYDRDVMRSRALLGETEQKLKDTMKSVSVLSKEVKYLRDRVNAMTSQPAWKCSARAEEEVALFRKMLEEGTVESLDFVGTEIRLLTEPIVATCVRDANVKKADHKYELGKYDIVINVENPGIRIQRHDGIVGGVHHPHITSGGNICWGEYKDQVFAMLGARDFRSLIPLLLLFLRSYTDWDKYASATVFSRDWQRVDGCACMDCCGRKPNEHDYTCNRCDVGIPEGEVWYYGDEPMCRPCFNEVAFICTSCGDAWGNDEEYHADDSGESYCPECANDNVYHCELCEVYYEAGTTDRPYSRCVCDRCREDGQTRCARCCERARAQQDGPTAAVSENRGE